jgi:hypothetical protein
MPNKLPDALGNFVKRETGGAGTGVAPVEGIAAAAIAGAAAADEATG